MPSERDWTFDALKGGLIVLVILGHWLEYGFSHISNRILFNYIYLFHMPLFIGISGFFSKREEWTVFFRKALSLFETYVVAQVLYLITAYLFQGKSIQWSSLYVPNAAAWYLLSLLIWRSLLQLSPGKLLDRRLSMVALTIIISLLAGFVPVEKTLSFQRTMTFLPFFFTGYALKESGFSFREDSSKWYWLIVLLLPLIGLIFLGNRDISSVVYGRSVYYNQSFNPLIMMLLRGLFIGLAFLMCKGILSLVPPIRNESVLCKMGRLSLFLYVYHIVFMRFFILIIRHFSLPLHFLAMLLYTFLTVVIIMTLCKWGIFRQSLHPFSAVISSKFGHVN